jgi:mannosyltransferase
MTTLHPETAALPVLARRASRWIRLRTALLGTLAGRATLFGAVGALAGWIGVGTPSYWGDEAASVMSAERSLPGLLALAGNVDAVHTTYYALLHVWISVAGTSELATRTPSSIAVGFLIAAIVVLGERLGGMRLGVAAGISGIALPRITYMATEARSYAFAAMGAAWIMVLVVALLGSPRTPARPGLRRLVWAALGLAIGAASWMFLYVVLLVPVIAVVLLVRRRDLLRSWIWTAAVAVVVTAPIALVAYAERRQIAFLAHRDVVSPDGVFVSQWFLKPWPALLGWTIILLAVVLCVRRRRDLRALLVAGAWTVLPTALLLLAGVVSPIYTSRYPSFCVGGVALLIGLGVVRIAETVRGRIPQLALGAVVLALVVGVAAPVYAAQRGPFGQAGGADFKQAAEEVSDLAHPGDAVVFGEDTKPSLDPRIALRLYPQHFAGLRDVELVTAFDAHPHLWDTVRPLGSAMPQLGDEVVAVERPVDGQLPPDVEQLIGAGYRLDAIRPVNVETVYRLVRRGS